MRKIFFFLPLHFLTFATLAQTAALSISLQDSSFFVAELNGRMFDKPSTVMNFFDLPRGEQDLQIYKLMRNGNSEIRKSVYEGRIRLQEDVLTTGYIDSFNQFRVLATEPLEKKSNTRSNRGRSASSKKAISREQFEGVIENLAGIADETERLRSAEGIISTSTFRSRQIAEMMLLFDNENRRIAVANYAYRYVIDPQNFGEVHHSLRYPSSHRRLIRRIR
ncbi:MAG: DUF4476 domain-containing protein [Bacteroidia bacterium]|jgi:hypothetical protein